ncbi:MAG: hypothetical protein KKA62_05760 [Nanoarchaeota archaeon]|nr:hypothetical protein [Nanoarchaeota archaeon]MBU1644084.1 hypothetical protein [Nanoarchaeota archaeon]MBU1977430.1 hypothetical protein [Nanoarchaeota archaeon]
MSKFDRLGGLLMGLTSLGLTPPTKAEEPPAKTEKETKNTKKLIPKNYVSVGGYYTTKNLAKEPYEKGGEANFNAEIDLPLTERLSLHHDLSFYSQWLSNYRDESIIRNKIRIDYLLDLRLMAIKSEKFNFFLGLGPGYRMLNDLMDYKGEKGCEQRISLGPRLTIGSYTKPVDIVLSGAYFPGKFQSNFERDRISETAWARLSITPKLDRFLLNTFVDYEFRHLRGDEGIANSNEILTFSIQPSVDITDYLRLSVDGKIIKGTGMNDHYEEFKIGGGLAFTWEALKVWP